MEPVQDRDRERHLMSVHLGGREITLTKKAKQLGYIKEVEQVWQHECAPPKTIRLSNSDAPLLSDGTHAEVGTQWQCSNCKTIWEVNAPFRSSPGIRKWEKLD